jgi:ubiquinone/menaquinone biosynthesis C-methylase UbiE
MGSIRWNRLTWGNLDNWSHFGDGWDFHADSCLQPYEEWKDSLVKEFLIPFLGPGIDVVEIGPGQGRWSEFIISNARSVRLVDLSANCLAVCRHRFADVEGTEVAFLEGDGRSLPLERSSVDLVWSFGTFVHIDRPEIDAYLGEIHRTLRPGGRFVVHHPGRPERVRAEGSETAAPNPGLRSEVSARQFSQMVEDHGLVLDAQVRRWGPDREFGLAFGDVITIGTRR